MQKRNLQKSAVIPGLKRTARRRLGLGLVSGLALTAAFVGFWLWGMGETSAFVHRPAFGPLPELAPILPFTLGQPALGLTQRLTTLANQPRLRAGIFALDLKGGSYVAVADDQSYPAASTIKLPILLALLQDLDRGLVRWDELLTITPQLKTSGSGILKNRPLGTQLRVWEVASLMITESDNTATHMLIARLGGFAQLNRRFSWWGLTHTALRAPLPDIPGQNTTSPHDLAIVLSHLDQGTGLNPWTRDRALDILRRVSNRSLLPKGLDKVENTALIAHKTGTIGIALADAGLVDLPNGKRYILATMVERPREDRRAAQLIQDISTQVAQAWSTPPIAQPLGTNTALLVPVLPPNPTTESKAP
ncbi:serine hydrolase [Anthocerotibacter panamensis]|uniref:serine hydrolase n=1 Tax=Anthocerotibacter panamensis TaxID=2857077 RepID=UPI001C40187B|nr:serine hydrolase [Anthocerotibacter panamensis]